MNQEIPWDFCIFIYFYTIIIVIISLTTHSPASQLRDQHQLVPPQEPEAGQYQGRRQPGWWSSSSWAVFQDNRVSTPALVMAGAWSYTTQLWASRRAAHSSTTSSSPASSALSQILMAIWKLTEIIAGSIFWDFKTVGSEPNPVRCFYMAEGLVQHGGGALDKTSTYWGTIYLPGKYH